MLRLFSTLLMSGALAIAQTAIFGGASTTQTGNALDDPAVQSADAPEQTPVSVQPVPASSSPQPATFDEAPKAPPAAPHKIVRSDFEQLAADTAGGDLPVFGRNLFTGPASTFAPMDHIPVPDDYVIGPGDEILVRVWGMVNFGQSLVVDRNGQISLPEVGVLNVAGLHYAQLQGFLHSALSRIYKNFDMNATMGRLRSIQIFVLGQVNQPGLYTVSSLSTLVNALFASGGPLGTGSMRGIQLRRGNRVISEFDLYDLQQRGDKSHDSQLLPGDIIFVPPVGEQIALIGNVNQPGIYELKGKTTIADALKDAGGLTGIAAIDMAILERIQDHRRLVEQIPLTGDSTLRVLHGGDILRIFPISPKFDNAVTLRGNVATPGRFPWHVGMKISDLIPTHDFLVTRNHWQSQNHQIGSDRPEAMAPWQTLNRMGAGGSPDSMESLSSNSAEINWDYASIERLNLSNLSTQLIHFNLGKAIDEPSSTDDLDLKPGDVVTIFSRKDLALPIEKHLAFVRIGGEVNTPGVYRIKPGDTLQDILRQAGGFTAHSYAYGTVLTRISAQQKQQEQLNLSLARMRRDLISMVANNPQTAAQTTDTQSKSTSQIALGQNLIDQLASVKPTGRVVLDLKPTALLIEDLPPFILEDGDSITVPARLETVQIVGAVYNENAFRFQPHKTVAQYLKSAGGTTRDADTSHIYVIRADGSSFVNHSNSSIWNNRFDKITLMPGDAIVVPIHIKIPSNVWQNIAPIAQIVTTAAILGTYLK
jgi:polysaccharide export outer membrane protein